MLIKYILYHEDPDSIKSGKLVISGWIRQYRKQTDLCFMNINDGSCPQGIQVICDKANDEEIFNKLDNINVGCYIKLTGNLVDSPAKGQKYEIQICNIIEYNDCPIQEYPIEKNVKLPTLRKMAHLRCRTKTFGCVYRIRNTVLYETHNFWQKNDFLHLDPNIITTNECEGGAGVFTVSEIMDKDVKDIPTIEKTTKIDYSNDHFRKQTYLTVSSQLQLEGLACGMGNCYTTNKSFRSEHSLTYKHMSEFTHLEIEMVNCSNMDLMKMGQKYIEYIITQVYKKNYDDIVELNKFVCKGLLDKFNKLKNLKFYYKTYDECINDIQKHSKIKCLYGEDLSSEMEEFLTNYNNGAVFVYDWPLSIKSFYMKQKEKDLCENFDLLMPFNIGELIGGSMREHNLEKLIENMTNKNVSKNGLEWYIDLRRFGSIPHGGFGLGLDRLIMLVSGMSNIKDVVPYPVYYQSCDC